MPETGKSIILTGKNFSNNSIRNAMKESQTLIADKIISTIPSEDVIRSGIQKVIDEEVNPGVAGHGGQINLLAVKGNSVTIQMGGGCQGCSAADLTLKQGIHTSFRKAVPEVGAIFDETDHTACLLYTSPSPRDRTRSRMPSSA